MKRLLVGDLIIEPRPVEIPIKGDKVTLWITPIEDTEKTMATAMARRVSRQLRKLLANRKSEEFEGMVLEDLEAADEASLRKIWANGKLIDRAIAIRENSLEDRDVIPEPEGGVTPKQMDEYEDAVDDAEENREEQVTKALETAVKELDEESQKIKSKDLFESAIPSIIEIKCNQAYETEFVSQLIFRCTFTDKALTKKAFANVGQVYRLIPSAKTKLTNEHIGLMLEPEAVKN